MEKELFFKNFISTHNKTQHKTRFFVVFIISFFFQIHLLAAVPKISFGEKNSLADEVENTIAADTANTPAHVSATISSKQTQAIPNKNIHLKSTPVISADKQTENSVIFFVTPRTTVFGLENIHNAKIVVAEEETNPKKVSKSSNSERLNTALSAKKARKKLAKAVKKKVQQKKVSFRFSVAPGGSSDFKNQSSFFFVAVISPFNPHQKSGLVSFNSEKAAAISRQIKKQKFYSSLSYLQFSKLLDSFLRGPPNF